MNRERIAKQFGFCVISLGVILTSGCASILGGTSQKLAVHARTPTGEDIAGAHCKLTNSEGSWYVSTPGTVTVHDASDILTVKCRTPDQLAGFSTSGSSLQPLVLGNLIIGGVIGIGVDFLEGAAYVYPGTLDVELASPRRSTVLGNAGAFSATALPTATREVSGAGQTLIAAHADSGALCATDQTAPAVTVVEQSRHGDVEIRQGKFVPPGAGSSYACGDGKIYGTRVLYAPAAGYHGTDTVRYEVASAAGHFSRTVEITVK
jgi:hypothetical protein